VKVVHIFIIPNPLERVSCPLREATGKEENYRHNVILEARESEKIEKV
jgi:hypothetical protein